MSRYRDPQLQVGENTDFIPNHYNLNGWKANKTEEWQWNESEFIQYEESQISFAILHTLFSIDITITLKMYVRKLIWHTMKFWDEANGFIEGVISYFFNTC